MFFLYMYYAYVCKCKCERRRKINNRIICSLDDISVYVVIVFIIVCMQRTRIERRINRSSIDRR